MTTKTTDTDVINPELEIVTLASGLEVEVQRIKLRQLMRLLKIVTRTSSLSNFKISENSSNEEAIQSVLTSILFYIPEAEDETVDFLLSMVLPVGFNRGKGLSKTAKAENEAMISALEEELYNPELEDLVNLIKVIVTNEVPHIRALGNQLATLFKAQVQNTVAKQESSSKETSESSTPED